MTRKPLEELSAKIREAISPPKRESATTRILDGVEPLPILKSAAPQGKVESPESSEIPETPFSGTAPVTGATGGEKERENPAGELLSHLAQTISIYTQLTKNPWLETDTTAYIENCLDQIPLDKIRSVMLAVSERAGCRINSFTYFVKEISAFTNQGTVTARKRALAAIVKRVRDNHVGRANYGMPDLVYDVKSACVRENVVFENDVFNEILRGYG
jgi:hypothetical protein